MTSAPWRRVGAGACLAFLAALVGAGSGGPVHARVGAYHVALIRALYSDVSSSPNYSLEELRQAGVELSEFFNKLSNGRLALSVSVSEVRVNNTRDFYWRRCQKDGSEARIPCPPRLVDDAAQAAAAAGVGFGNVDGILLLQPWCGTDRTEAPGFEVTSTPATISRPGVNGTFQQSMLFECPLAAYLGTPGASGVAWNTWAHEIGHQLQLADGVDLTGNWGGHPSGFSSGYDLMDACPLCGEGGYNLLAPALTGGRPRPFADWLPDTKVVRISPSQTQPTVTSVVLAPAGQSAGEGHSARIARIDVAEGLYYLVTLRQRVGADGYGLGPGLYDEGIEILKVEESADPPVTAIGTCPYLFLGPCTNARQSTATCQTPEHLSPRKAGQVADRCWPYPLWHAGDSFHDRVYDVEIDVDGPVGDGYALIVRLGTSPGYPDVALTPWLTKPMNTWESPDIWVDSSCNGYESDLGPAGLRYGRRADGSVVGSGDDLCANHKNRLYARVQNVGDAVARNIQLSFKVPDPPALTIRDAAGWITVATAGPGEFPALAELAPGKSAEVFGTWTPFVAGEGQASDTLASAIQVKVNAVEGEVVSGNQDGVGEQEAIANVEAVFDPVSQRYGQINEEVTLRNPFKAGAQPPGPRTFALWSAPRPPAGWGLSIANDLPSVTLDPDETRRLGIRLSLPSSVPAGTSELLGLAASTAIAMEDPGIPLAWPGANGHHGTRVIGGVALAVRAVVRTEIELDTVLDPGGFIVASGQISPTHEAASVALDYQDPNRTMITRLARTGPDGRFRDVFEPTLQGEWGVRAFWQGDADHSRAQSRPRTVEVPDLPAPALLISPAYALADPVVVDGTCNVPNEYYPSEAHPFTDAEGAAGTIYLHHDFRRVYACLSAAEGQLEARTAGMYLDTAGNRLSQPDSDDLALRIDLTTGITSTLHGAPNGYEPTDLPGWLAAAVTAGQDGAEFAIPMRKVSLVCGATFGLAVLHQPVVAEEDAFGLPDGARGDKPSSWARAQLAQSVCPPLRTPTPTPLPRPTATPRPTVQLPDVGDAPDSSNSLGLSMPAYEFSADSAGFPTVFNAGSPPAGPLHRNRPPFFSLGPTISAEGEADVGPDADGHHNLDPQIAVADRDGGDDGLSLPISFPDCEQTSLRFTVNVLPGAPRQAYFNLWSDWDRSGRWSGAGGCQDRLTAPEWAIVNQVVALAEPGLHTYDTVLFRPTNADPNLATWLRASLSDTPAIAGDGSGPDEGWALGETEDYLLPGLTPTAPATETPNRPPSPSPTATSSRTPTRGASATPSPTPSPSVTLPASPTFTPTWGASPTPTDDDPPTPSATPGRPKIFLPFALCPRRR